MMKAILVVAGAFLVSQSAAANSPWYGTRQEIKPEHHVLAQMVAAEWPDLQFSSALADAAAPLDHHRDLRSRSS